MLLAGRCVQGVGGGGIITITQVIFCDIVPLRQRPKYFAMVLGAWSIGSIVGPVVGGSLVETASWRWCFHINYPFCGIGFIVAIVFVRLNAVSQLTIAQKLKRTDWIGAVLFVGGMTSFLVGLSWGGIQHPWKSAATLAPIILGLLCLVVFFCWQVYAKENTLLPMSLFQNRSSLAAFYSALINGLIVGTSILSTSYHSLTRAALHRIILRALLRYERSCFVFHQSWDQLIPSGMLIDSGVHNRLCIDLPSWSISMGHLEWLGHHYSSMWPVHSL